MARSKRVSRPSASLPLAVFGVALAVRLLHVWQIHGAPFFSVLSGDARAYDEWARRIAAGDWLGHEVFYQAPLYPYFLGGIYALAGHDLTIVRIVQAVVGSGSALFIALAAANLFSTRAGLVAGLLMACYAPAIFFDGILQKSVLDVFFMSLSVWLLSGLVREPERRWRGFALGAALGALSLTRENALALVAVVAAWTIVATPRPARRRATAVAIFAAGVGLVLLPVTVRNNMVGGGFYLTTSQFGSNFYIGNNPNADGSYMPLRYGRGAPEYERQDATELAERAAGRTLTPAEVSSYWTDRALDFILANPGRSAGLFLKKTAMLLNRGEGVDTESQEMYAEWSTPLAIGSWIGHFGLLVPLALFGLVATWSDRSRLWIFYALTIVYAGSVLIFYVFARYRFPLVPLLMPFAAAGALAAWRHIVDRTRPDGRAIAGVTAALVLCNWPLVSASMNRAVSELNLATALKEQGRIDDAVDHFRRAIDARHDFAPGYSGLAGALQAKGDAAQAIATYEQAIALQPAFPDAHYNLAVVLMDQQRSAEAAEHLRIALQTLPGSVEAHNNLGIALAAEGQLDAAIAEFRLAVKIDPASSKAHRNLGDALASRGNDGEAIQHFRRAVELAPDDGATRYDLASLLVSLGRPAEAITEFRRALVTLPDSVEAHNNLGIALASTGRIDEAIDEFRRALALRPDFADAQRNLAMALDVRRQAAR